MALVTAAPNDGATHDASFKELLSLLKPRVMLLVVFTGAVGMLMAPGSAHPFIQCLIVASIALGSGAGGMINMWYDRDVDSLMQRTARRLIPSGKVEAGDVLVIGVLLSFVSVGLLGLATNWLAAGWLGFAIFFYAVIYTMALKRHTPQNIVIGGAAGAFPPVIGWAAVTGSTPLEPWILFAIIFLWTPPHFWALALYRHQDYSNANIPMLPVTHGLAHTLMQMRVYSLLLLLVSLLPVMLGFAGYLYGAVALVSGIYLCALVWNIRIDDPAFRMAKKTFGFSILYLFLLFAALPLDHWLMGA